MKKLAHTVCVVLLVIFAGWPSVGRSAPIRVGVPSPSVSYFPAVVAWKMGYFAQEGLQVEFVIMKPSIIPAALLNGEIQFTTATGTASGAILKGLPFKVVIFFSIKLMDSLVTRPQFRTLGELRGKLIGVDSLGASTDVITRLILQKHGIDPGREVRIVSIGHEGIRLEQLKLGQIDAAMLGPQGVVVARRAGLRVLVDVADEIDLPFVGIATTTQMVEGRREEMKKFLRANIRGIRHAVDANNRTGVVALLADWLKLDQETAEYTYDIFLKASSRDGGLSRAGMEALVDERKRQMKVTGDIPLDRIFDFSVVGEINRELSKGK